MVVPLDSLIDFLVSRMTQSKTWVISCDVGDDAENVSVDVVEAAGTDG